MTTYGVLSTGFLPQPFNTIKDEIDADINSAPGSPFGTQHRVDPDSLFGNFNYIITTKLAELWMVAQDVYNSKTLQGSGVALDDAVNLSGITRLPAVNSTVSVIIAGSNGTIIPTNMTIQSIDNKSLWLNKLTSPTTIAMAATYNTKVKVNADNVITDLYTQFGTLNSSGMTAVLMCADIVNSIHGNYLDGTDPLDAIDNGDGTMILFRPDGQSFDMSVTTGNVNVTILDYGVIIPFVAIDNGPVAGVATMITNSVTAVSGVTRVINVADAIIGSNIESDADLRLRFLAARSGLGYAALDSIRNRILQEVSGVNWCFVYQNSLDITDQYGIPPHTIFVVVDCDTSLEQAVAQKIWKVKAGGINTWCPSPVSTYPSVQKYVNDASGNSQQVLFSHPIPEYVHINIVISLHNSKIAFPNDGVQQIIRAIYYYYTADPEYIVANISPNPLAIGKDLLVGTLNIPIYSVPGVLDISTRQVAVTSTEGGTPSYQTNDLIVNPITKLIVSLSNINVSIA